MAFFKFRLPGQTSSSSASEAVNASPAESLEVLRKRARHRLMGSVVLVLAAVIGFPLLFDTQPRPVAVDTPIDIPDRSASSAPAISTVPAAPVTSVAGTVSSAPVSPVATGALPTASVLDANEELVPARSRSADKPVEKVIRPPEPAVVAAQSSGFKVDFGQNGAAGPVVSQPAANVASKPVVERQTEPKPEPKKVVAESKVERKPEPKTEAKVASSAVAEKEARDKAKARDEAAKARSLLDGKEPAKAGKSGDERVVVQVGAYSDAAKLRDVRQKLEAAGFTTYTQVIETKDGKRTRVRVGPFGSKEEADKNAQKIRKLQLETSILKI
jgi:DedD protein